jgi:actin-like ATPase involved in cell morphogenesis
MGDRDYRVEVGGQTLSPVDVSAMILRKLVAAASEQLGEKVENVVISVPAYFNNNQKEDTRLAGEKAGLKVLRLIPEPTAAAIAYGLNKNRDQTILVYDLGGGTFDVSILKVLRNDFAVVGIGGAHDLGGEDFDRRLIDLIQQQLRLDPRALGQGSEADSAKRQEQLKEAAEKAKIELSATEEVEVEIPDVIPGELFRMKITRGQFEAAISDLVERTVKITLKTLKDCGLGPDDVDRIVLVGGSTRVCTIQKVLAEKVSDPYIADNVDEVVAQGAAIMAANLSGVEESLAPIEVTNVSAYSLGIRTEKDKFAVLIPRGTALPVQQRKVFTTARDNADRTDVVVFQGDEKNCSDNEQIGGFGLTGIARAKAGVPRIDVTFAIDADDILTVSAKDLSTGSGGQVQIEKFEPKPYDPKEETTATLESLRIGVSPRGCDDAGAILRRLGLKYKDRPNLSFAQPRTVAQHDVLFINCLCDPTQMFGGGTICNPRKNKRALSNFVARGGVLYVSDYAYENVSTIFPRKITFQGKVGPQGTYTLQVVDPEMQKVVGRTTKGLFGPAYVVVKSVSADCTVHMTRGSEPVLVSFPHGDGHVIYTSFHNDVNAGPDVIKVVSYVVLQAVSLATSTPLVELVETARLR